MKKYYDQTGKQVSAADYKKAEKKLKLLRKKPLQLRGRYIDLDELRRSGNPLSFT